MPPKASDEALADAVIQNVEFGTYPDSEDVISAELPASALPQLLDTIQKARDEITGEIRALSRDAASDVDSWIAQSKQLQADIERSKATAREIVQEAEAGKTLRAAIDDASSKQQLLQSELAFNEALADTLQRVKSISGTLDETDNLSREGHMLEGIEKFEEAVDAAKDMSRFENAQFTSILHQRIAQLGADMASQTRECWNILVVESINGQGFTINSQVEKEGISTEMGTVVEALSRLNALEDNLMRFCKRFESVIVRPRLSPAGARSSVVLTTSGSDIHTTQSTTTSVKDAIRDVESIVKYLDDRFPSSAPRIWLSKRKEVALATIRSTSFKGLGTKKVAERIETQKVSKNEAVIAQDQAQSVEAPNNQASNDWDDAWEEEEEKPAAEENTGNVDEEEDTSAWDVDDGAEENEDKAPPPQPTSDEPPSAADDGEAWGWGDDEAEQSKKSDEARTTSRAPRVNGDQDPLSHSEHELTLRETYTVTAIPDSLMEVILQTVSDAERLSTDEFSNSTIATAAIGLYSIPSLLLALYRATAGTYYAKDVAGNMLIYNDSSRLSDELNDFLSKQREKDSHSKLPSAKRPSTRLRLEADIRLLEGCGKRAYGREMEAQRTILRDLLDGAQGFSDCTVQPFAAECDNAVAMTVDRVRDVNNQWKDVLSHSARVQSLGNLVSTIVNKIIVDIEDMSDISEEESKRLRHFCDQIGKLNDLFVQDAPDGSGEQVDMTGIYTPNWFKFQYLGEIMESSLADIKYLWQEGELSLEFEPEEVVDLIEALFAESDYRRNAIAEIRRSGRHR
ncbi:hypothetical protein NA57DRAFT_38787 [Rhizodiscina lignyota]|uniref:ZW10 C-terminal helical domain-containing protein n=1 Tax=Rhizodiscina lignyota TaxID=1504668 RepID=A0A9P4IF61_9PEZI|nr:hypothetical protein NA57DRAFT_38787 [Rhizodiscina lignyota]